jgi:hypothetical protein
MSGKVFRRHTEDREVEKGGTNSIEEALGEQKLPDLGAETGKTESETHAQDSGYAKGFSAFHIEPCEDGVDKQ